MPRALSLSARKLHDTAYPGDVEVCLMAFEHPDLAEPLRISTDNTTRISDDASLYGTRSTWRSESGDEDVFTFVPVSIELPADDEDVPQSVRLSIDIYDASLPALLRSFDTRATMHLAICLASAPSVIEAQFVGLQIVSASITNVVTIEATRRPIEEEPAPMDIIGPARFPGLYP